MVKLLLLGAPQLGGDCWHDDIHQEAQTLGWQADYLQANGTPTEDIARAAKGADLLLWCRTHGHDPDGDITTLLRQVEDAGTVTASLHLDLYWGIPRREAQIGVHPWWSAQHVFTADGGPRDWAGRGVNHHWCPPAFGTRFLGLTEPVGRHRYIFTGTSIPGIHGPHRAQLLRWARNRWRADFCHYGRTLPAAYRHELSGLVAYAHCVLGDSAPAPHYWSNRIVHTMGRGGVLAHPHTPGLTEQGFADGLNILLYDRHDFARLGERLSEMTPGRRQNIRTAAVELVASRHLWRHRLTQIAEKVLR